MRCRTIRHIANRQRFLIDYFYCGAHLNFATTFTAIVFTHIYRTARRKVRNNFGFLAFQYANRTFDEFAEIVRHYFSRQANGNSFHPLEKE